jgi:hypothetical protein
MAPSADPALPRPGGDRPSTPLSHLFVRVGWMLLGNVLLVFFAVAILLEPAWTFTWKDALFWSAAATVVVLRWIDVTRMGGLTAQGEPATRRDVARYAAGVLVVSGAVWSLAQTLFLAG